ncbi:MAG: enoyl-CoA hydratase/isomerase family protein [bacterium]
MYKNIIVDRDPAGIVTLTVDRPGAKNAIDVETMGEIRDVVGALEQDRDARALIITGAGDEAFISGGDLKNFRTLKTEFDGRDMSIFFHTTLNRMAALEIPVIAAINGYAYGGGCEMALYCDFRIAAENAMFGMRQIKLGIMSAWGGGQRFLRLVGRGKALYYMMTGDTFDAAEAYRIGLVERVVTRGDALPTAHAIAQKIAENPATSVRFIKRSVNEGADMPLRNAIAYESEMLALLWGTEDHREAETAFAEKRMPVFNKPREK